MKRHKFSKLQNIRQTSIHISIIEIISFPLHAKTIYTESSLLLSAIALFETEMHINNVSSI